MSQINKSICLIGGGGFIGTALRSYLLAQCYTIYIIGRKSTIPLNCNEIYYSVQTHSFHQLEEMFQDKELNAIIDLAYSSVPSTSYENPIKDFSENLYNVNRHLEFAQAVMAKKYLYISSGGTVYGDTQSAVPIKEKEANFPLSPYGITKLACERYVYMYYRLHGIPAVIIRPSNIYGPGQRPFRGQGLAATALGLSIKREPISIYGTGNHVRDYLYIDDFCTGLMELAAVGVPGEIYNMGCGAGDTILDLIGYVDRAIAKDGFDLKRQVLPERPFDVHYNVLDIQKIREQTGWFPHTKLEQGIQQTWKWMQQFMSTTKPERQEQ